MENTTRLLQRQEAALDGRHVLVVESNDASLVTLAEPASLSVHSDDLTVGPDQWAVLPQVPAGTDLLIIPLPKSSERLQCLLAVLAGQLSSPCELWLVGPAKGGVKGALKHLQRHCDELLLVDSARHCKLYSGMLQPGPVQPLSDWQQSFTAGSLTVHSYPGVFSHGRLDEGTALLLDALDGLSLAAGRALDLGCGAGVRSLALASQGWTVDGLDVSAAAVAASQANGERLADVLQGSVRFRGSYLYQHVSARYDLLVTNPPFHQGRQRTMAVTEALIAGARERLVSGGELWLVANRELPYMQWLQQAFTGVDIVRETSRFRVYRAR